MTRTMLALAISATVACGLDASAQRTSRSRTLQVQVTAYCDQGETASGVQTRRGIVAADPDVLPLGSRIRVEGLAAHNGTYDVEDTGARGEGTHHRHLHARLCRGEAIRPPDRPRAGVERWRRLALRPKGHRARCRPRGGRQADRIPRVRGYGRRVGEQSGRLPGLRLPTSRLRLPTSRLPTPRLSPKPQAPRPQDLPSEAAFLRASSSVSTSVPSISPAFLSASRIWTASV